jgi:hypothetical protein
MALTVNSTVKIRRGPKLAAALLDEAIANYARSTEPQDSVLDSTRSILCPLAHSYD